MGEFSIEEFFMREGNFHEGSVGFSSIKKNNEKIDMKKFFQLKVRSSIKTGNEQKLLRIRGVHLLLKLASLH